MVVINGDYDGIMLIMVGSHYGGNADYGGIMLIMVGSHYSGIHLLRGNCTHVRRKRMGGWYLVG